MDLIEIFNDMPEYAIIKMDNRFPAYAWGSDIDIICSDIISCRHHLCERLPLYTSRRNDNHYHLDLLNSGKLELRFDLYSLFISEKYTRDVLTFRVKRKGVWVPLGIHDSVAKCYEFLRGKDKYKNYIRYKTLLDEYAR